MFEQEKPKVLIIILLQIGPTIEKIITSTANISFEITAIDLQTRAITDFINIGVNLVLDDIRFNRAFKKTLQWIICKK